MASYESEFRWAWGSFNDIPEWTWRPIKQLRERFYQRIYDTRPGYDAAAAKNAWKEEWSAQRKRFTLFRLSDLPADSSLYHNGGWYDHTEIQGTDVDLAPLRLEITTGDEYGDEGIVIIGMFSVWKDGEVTMKRREENARNCVDAVLRTRLKRDQQQHWEMIELTAGTPADLIVEWRFVETLHRTRST